MQVYVYVEKDLSFVSAVIGKLTLVSNYIKCNLDMELHESVYLQSMGDVLLKRHTIRIIAFLGKSLQMGFPPKKSNSNFWRFASLKSDVLWLDGIRPVMLLFMSDIMRSEEFEEKTFGRVKIPEIWLESK